MYKYKKQKAPKPSNHPTVQYRDGKQEILTGLVQNKKAAQGEERLYRALLRDARVKNVYFRLVTNAPRGFPGAKELDFLVGTTGGFYAVSVKDTTFVHAGNSKDARDVLTEELQVDWLKRMGAPVSGVITIDARDLDSQDMADKKEREVILA